MGVPVKLSFIKNTCCVKLAHPQEMYKLPVSNAIKAQRNCALCDFQPSKKCPRPGVACQGILGRDQVEISKNVGSGKLSFLRHTCWVKGAHPSGNGVTNAIKAQWICARSELQLLKKGRRCGVACTGILGRSPGRNFIKWELPANCHFSGTPNG